MSNSNPSPSTRFGAENGNKRHSGSWKKTDTIRYKIEQASYLSDGELQAIVDNPEEATLVKRFAKATLRADWRMIKEITEMLYGKPKETVDTNLNLGVDISAEQAEQLIRARANRSNS